MPAKLTFGNFVKPASSAADAHSNSQAWWMQRGRAGSSLKEKNTSSLSLKPINNQICGCFTKHKAQDDAVPVYLVSATCAAEMAFIWTIL